MGGHKVPTPVMEEVLREAADQKDMVIFPSQTLLNPSLTGQSLTNRTLLSFKYAYETFKFKYVLKCDDDTFVDLLRIASELSKFSVLGFGGYFFQKQMSTLLLVDSLECSAARPASLSTRL